MDLSKRPNSVKVSDFMGMSIKATNRAISPNDLDSLSSFPVGDIKPDSDIFVFSMTCPYSANAFIEDIKPKIKKRTPIVLANLIRSDNDLNIWIRIFKLRAIYRLPVVDKIYTAAYERKLDSTEGIHRFLDDYLSNVPLDKVYSGHTTEKAALSALTTTVSLMSLYGIESTPFSSKLK